MVIPHHIQVYPDRDGLPSVSITVDLTPAQIDAALHALRVVREARYVPSEMSTDDALALRELTSVVDTLADLSGGQGIGRIHVTVARLGALRTALTEFCSGEHLEREGDAAARPVVLELLDAVDDLFAEAVHAALQGSGTAHE